VDRDAKANGVEMKRMPRNNHLFFRRILTLHVACMAILLLWTGATAAHDIVDMAGRRVSVPETIRKVYGTSPPATYMVYAMDPALVAGLNFPFNPDEKQYLDPRVKNLPVVGGWFGQGQVANLETLLTVAPDIVLVWRWHGRESAINAKIEQALAPLGIPIVYVVLDDLADYPEAFAFLGKLFGRQERARALQRYAEATLETAARVRAAAAPDEQVSVYYAEGPDGLNTECHASVHVELITLCGGRNVHRCDATSRYGMQKISMEQVLIYDPQVILSHEALFFDKVYTHPKWQNIRAVRNKRVCRIPRIPFNWFDRPPSFMRLLGTHWLMHRLYPDLYPIDLVAETQAFYRLFLQVELDAAGARSLLQP
jgi:iron complex transport system substrate-binding protein